MAVTLLFVQPTAYIRKPIRSATRSLSGTTIMATCLLWWTRPAARSLRSTTPTTSWPREFATGAGGTPANVQLRIDLAYTPAGQIYTEKRYSDTGGTNLVGQTQFTYDPVGNVSEVKHTNASGTTLLDYQYQWDSADRLSSETDTYSGTPTTTTYGYDASNELTSTNSATYTYDANGNRTMAGYQTGADNELLSDGTWNYAYDPAGNMISQVGISNGLSWYYTYDNQNHVLTASQYSGGQLVEQETNSYDVFGNMVEQDETSGGNTVVTKFANQVKNTSGVSQVWADLNATNQIQTRRVYLDAVDAVCGGSAPTVPRAVTDRPPRLGRRDHEQQRYRDRPRHLRPLGQPDGQQSLGR